MLANDISPTFTGVQLESGLIENNHLHNLGITGDDHGGGYTIHAEANPGKELPAASADTTRLWWVVTSVRLFGVTLALVPDVPVAVDPRLAGGRSGPPR